MGVELKAVVAAFGRALAFSGLAAFLALCLWMIGRDAGPQHIARVQTPVVGADGLRGKLP
jgi:ADP-heptose:LPS heptosyltransferase